ncbi:SDR family oxidoreductase [Planococcus salinus]|uniref:NAD-dependent epimerase/dehydratase family protein n=1 Tax=Planococcus salinus TaxID=1848460 RepID=A0A3M8P4B5_9BACL|nr:SDR family oxidoreductase [Planococcus salinus]RNF38509.1 NAD-dependent epimerase/dehydratase family protein [Planococcus salinus]
MTEVVFTGFPGFIASQLVQRKAQEGAGISVIHLPSEQTKAEQEVARIEAKTNCRPIRLLTGDITQSNLGLSNEDLAYLRTKSIEFWHLAAIYDLAVPQQVARRVNIEGTGNVNEFLLKLPSVTRYMYFSTAYVAGNREGVLYETELKRPEKFKNFYEETKYEAEVLVEELKRRLPVTIIRPGIVRGHSKTGETIKFDGPYFFLNMIDRMKILPVIPYIGRSTSSINVVPVDYVLEASLYLSKLGQAAGETVHLTDPRPHPVEEVYRSMVYHMTGKFPKSRLPLNLAAVSLKLPTVRRLLGVEAETMDYLVWQAAFDTANAERLLQGSGIECADFLETMPSMVSFYQRHKADKNYHVPIH